MDAGGERRGLAYAIGGAIGGTIVVITAVGVGGDFPLSDDWSYAFSARSLCTTGTIRFLPWTGASLVFQAGYGAALCRLAGFSFTALRASTLALAASGVVAFLLLLRHAGVRPPALGLGTALFALNPLYVNLAFTFMTDVPFTVFAIWSAYCYVRGLGERRPGLLLCGGMLAAAALLVRQHGIFVAGAAALAALAARDRSAGARMRDALYAAALPALVFVAYLYWLFVLHGAPPAVTTKIAETTRGTAAGFANCAFRGVETLSFLLCPLAVALAPRLRILHRRQVRLWWILLAALAAILWLRERALMPYLTNVMYDLGLGALSLRDTLFLALRPPLQIGTALVFPLTVLATGAGGLLLAAWTSALSSWRDPVRFFLLLALVCLFGGTLLHTRYYFDRYLLVVVPFAIAAALAAHPVLWVRPAAVALTALLAWYAVAGTHDYLAWNRARYAGLAALTATGVPPTAIDGGMEFNAWNLAPVLGTWPSDAEARSGQPDTVRSWWWVVDDRYVASFRPLPRYRIWREMPFTRWLVPGTGRVLILERIE